MSIFSEVARSVASGVVHLNFVGPDKRRKTSGTGFLLRGLLVTSRQLVNDLSDDFKVLFRTINSDPEKFGSGTVLSVADLRSRLKASSDVDAFDYAVYDLPELRAENLHTFDFHTNPRPALGDEALLLGYPLDHLNLTCHRGTISSFYNSGPASLIQLDANVSHGHTGGPLLSLPDGRVIGMITRKGAGLTRLFDSFKKNIDESIHTLEGCQGKIVLQGINIPKALLDNQKALKGLSDEILRSACTGTGHALSADHLAQDPVWSADK